MSRYIGIIGLIIIAILVTLYVRKVFNYDPVFMGETKEITGYITDNKIVAKGKGATHQLDFTYAFQGNRHQGSYFSSKSISRLTTGDSLRLEVSLNSPGKYKVVGYFKGGVFIEVD